MPWCASWCALCLALFHCQKEMGSRAGLLPIKDISGLPPMQVSAKVTKASGIGEGARQSSSILSGEGQKRMPGFALAIWLKNNVSRTMTRTNL